MHTVATEVLWKHFYSLAPTFLFSTKYIDPWGLKIVVSNVTGTNQWKNCCISLDFNFRSLSEPQIPLKLEPHDY
jgi:hypothetical protein